MQVSMAHARVRSPFVLQDRIIGKKVFKVRGTIPAANFIRLPKSKGHMLGLTGRFVYMQVGGKAGCDGVGTHILTAVIGHAALMGAHAAHGSILQTPHACTRPCAHACLAAGTHLHAVASSACSQIKVSPVKVFVIHLEVVTQDQNVHRVSISSMYKAEQLRVRDPQFEWPNLSCQLMKSVISLVDALHASENAKEGPSTCVTRRLMWHHT